MIRFLRHITIFLLFIFGFGLTNGWGQATEQHVCVGQTVDYHMYGFDGSTVEWKVNTSPVSVVTHTIDATDAVNHPVHPDADKSNYFKDIFSYTWTSAGTYTVEIVETTPGCSSDVIKLTVYVHALPAGTLTSSDSDNTICAGDNVIFTATGGTNYNFKLDGSSVQNGAGSTYTTSSLANGQEVTVEVTNANGCINTYAGITTTVLTPPLDAGNITGDAIVQSGQTGVIYRIPAVSNATNYEWVYSGTGANIINNGDEITVNFAADATSGELKVRGTNACGIGGYSELFSIYVVSPCETTIENWTFNEPVLTQDWKVYSTVNGWSSTPHGIEIWRSGFLGIDTPDGGQFCELNSNGANTMYQDLDVNPGAEMVWAITYRYRNSSTESIRLRIGPVGGSLSNVATISNDSGDTWVVHSGSYTVPGSLPGGKVRFQIETVSPSSSSGNLIDGIQFYSVNSDVEPPQFIKATLPANTIDLGGACEFTLPDYTIGVDAIDNCDADLVITQNPAAGEKVFGGEKVILTATDEAGNVDTYEMNVLGDNVAPTAKCKDITVQLDASGSATITATDVNDGSVDNCTAQADLILSVDQDSFNCSDTGANVVTLTVEDQAGNKSTCTANVTVEDNRLAGFKNNLSDITRDADDGQCGAIVYYNNPVVIDNCAFVENISGYTYIGIFNGHSYYMSNTQRTAKDAGEEAFKIGGHLVTIDDELENNFLKDNQILKDNVVEGIWIGLNDIETEGTYKWLTGENISYQNWNLTSGEPNNSGGNEDYTELYMKYGAATTGAEIGKWNDNPGTANKRYVVEFEGPRFKQTSGLISGSEFPVGTTTNTFEIINADGSNTGITTSFDVVVADKEAPTASNPDPITVQCISEVPVPNITVVTDEADNCTVTPTVAFVSDSNNGGSGTVASPYVVTRTYSVTDDASNSINVTQTITAIDNVGPVVTALADVTGECSATAVAPTITDACAGTITGTTTDPLTYNTQGTHVITWTFDDGLGEGTSSNPFKSLGAARTVTSNGRYYFDLGNGIFQADVDTSEGGGWVLILQYHHAGGTNPATSVIGVGDDLPINSNASLGTDLSGNSAYWGHVGNAALSDMAGAEELRWYATTSAHSRVIHFRSAVGLAYAQTGSGSFNGIESGYTLLSDHSAKLPSVARNEFGNQADNALVNFPFWLSGTYHWGVRGNGNRWEVDDYVGNYTNSTIHKVWVRGSLTSMGNVVTATQKVIVDDDTPPNAVCQDITIQLDDSGNASITAAQINNGSNDVCGISSLSLDKTTFTTADVGTNTVTLTVTDNHSNVSTCTATVTVEDNVAPNAICQDITIYLDATGNISITAAQIDNGSSDASGIQSLSVSPNSFDCDNVGPNSVTLTVTDKNGNVSTCTATVTVSDNIEPTISCVANQTVNITAGSCDAVVNGLSPTTSDNCSVVLQTWTMSGATTANSATTGINDASGQAFNIGTTTVTYAIEDAAGNEATCSFDVTVTKENNISLVDVTGTTNPETDAGFTNGTHCPDLNGLQAVIEPSGNTYSPGTSQVQFRVNRLCDTGAWSFNYSIGGSGVTVHKVLISGVGTTTNASGVVNADAGTDYILFTIDINNVVGTILPIDFTISDGGTNSAIKDAITIQHNLKIIPQIVGFE